MMCVNNLASFRVYTAPETYALMTDKDVTASGATSQKQVTSGQGSSCIRGSFTHRTALKMCCKNCIAAV
jgi:hypothetical protein